MNTYDIILSARIEIGGTYEAETVEQAVEQAKLELRTGKITDIAVDRAVYVGRDGVDEQTVEA